MTRRAGYTLLEVLVAIAIALGMLAVSIPAISSLLELEQHRAAREMTLTLQRLHDEAVLRNMTFRVAHHLDGAYWQVEAGAPDAMIFADPDAREAFMEERQRKLDRHGEDAVDDGVPYEAIPVRFKKKVELPNGTVYGGVYTPQHGTLVIPNYREEDPEEPLVVHNHLMASGLAEPTVIHLVDADDPTRGYSIVVEPLSGRVRLIDELIDWRDAFGDVPQEGPRLP